MARSACRRRRRADLGLRCRTARRGRGRHGTLGFRCRCRADLGLRCRTARWPRSAHVRVARAPRRRRRCEQARGETTRTGAVWSTRRSSRATPMVRTRRTRRARTGHGRRRARRRASPSPDLWGRREPGLPGQRVGRGHWKFRRSEVLAWLESRGRSDTARRAEVDVTPATPSESAHRWVVGPIRGRWVVRLVRWRQGLAVARRNPKGIRSVADLASGCAGGPARKGIGRTAVLDRTLANAKIAGREIEPVTTLGDHRSVAQAVAFGACDVGLTVESAALDAGLRFIGASTRSGGARPLRHRTDGSRADDHGLGLTVDDVAVVDRIAPDDRGCRRSHRAMPKKPSARTGPPPCPLRQAHPSSAGKPGPWHSGLFS